MALSNAICPMCNTVNAVDNTKEAVICQKCKAPFVTEKAIAAWDNAYGVTLHRQNDPKISNSITFLTVYKGNMSTVANDGSLTLLISEKEFEIPVYITDNNRKHFEGVLAGTGDGKDIEITWAASRTEKTLGVIVASNNPTVRFIERPGAAQKQQLQQESNK